jgi:hypothetical protein
MPRIGLIAGNRKFPLIVSCEAKKRNYSVIAIAIKGETSTRINKLVEKAYWLGLDEFSKIIEVFHKEKINEAIMAGQVSPRQLFRPKVRNNPQIKNLLDSLKDKKADTIFGAIARRLEKEDIRLLDSTFLLGEFMPSKGVLTKNQPDFSQWEDIYLGLDIAKQIAYLDIGQTVAIKDKAVVAVEALEGTDNLIKRTGKITHQGAIIIKVSKPAQDMRFDVPVVGLNTIKNLIRAKAGGLSIESEKTLFIDKEQSLKLADSKDLFVVAV